MTLNISTIRTALADQIRTAVNSGSLRANVYDYPPDSPELPAILVLPRADEDGQYVTYHGSFGNPVCHIGLQLEIRVNNNNDIDSARAIDAHLSSFGPSIIDALSADPTLGGAAETTLMAGASVPGRFVAGVDDTRTWMSTAIAIQVKARRQA